MSGGAGILTLESRAPAGYNPGRISAPDKGTGNAFTSDQVRLIAS